MSDIEEEIGEVTEPEKTENDRSAIAVNEDT